MDNQQQDDKQGFSVNELEGMAKKYRYELVFGGLFIVACFFAYLFSMMGWAILLATIGGVIGSLLPRQIERYVRAGFLFVFKQERVTQIIVGCLLLAISIFLSPLIYLGLGLLGGSELYHGMYQIGGGE